MCKIYAQKVSSSGPKTMLISGGCWDGIPATSTSYVGKVSQTHDFIPCQAWASQDPQAHSLTNANFPLDGSLVAAENYCRDPGGGEGRHWCYRNVYTGARWDYCDTECNGIFMFAMLKQMCQVLKSNILKNNKKHTYIFLFFYL